MEKGAPSLSLQDPGSTACLHWVFPSSSGGLTPNSTPGSLAGTSQRLLPSQVAWDPHQPEPSGGAAPTT